MGQSVWARPRVTPPPSPPTIIVRGYTPAPAPVVQAIRGGATHIPYYDQSRIFKDIKVVSDLRQSGSERGETQTGDNGTLGPGSIAPPRTGTMVTAEMPEKNNLVPIALAIGMFLLLGG